MKNILVLIMLVLSVGCMRGPRGYHGDSVVGIPGHDGSDGVDGTNGNDGVDGSDGVDGDDYVSNAEYFNLSGTAICYEIQSTGYFFKKVNNTSNEVKIWTVAGCNGAAIINLSLTEQNNDMFVVPGTTTVLFVSGNNDVGMRALTVSY